MRTLVDLAGARRQDGGRVVVLGVMAGASHRVVTERSKIAMPEVTIGLFPDVGASWFLGRMPQRIGLFLGLTTTPMHPGDALWLGLAPLMQDKSESVVCIREVGLVRDSLTE